MIKSYAFAIFICGLAAVALDGASLGTETWAYSKFSRIVNDVETCRGIRVMGLFSGTDRYEQTNESCVSNGQTKTFSVVNGKPSEGNIQINTAFDIAIIAFCGLAIFFGLLVVFVAGYNVCSKPYEIYSGPTGLLIYLIAGVISTLIAMVMFIVFGFLEVPNSYAEEGYQSENFWFGYSFYIFIASFAPLLLGILLLFLSGKDIKKNLKKSLPGAKKREKEEMEFHNNAIEF